MIFLAVLVLIFQLAIFFRDLRSELRPKLNPGTWLSLVRLVALSLLAGFLAAPRPLGQLAWVPFALALIFNVSDLFDGYLARRFGGGSNIGEKLDIDLDSRGMLVGSLLVVHYGMVGWWFVLAGFARYIFVFAGRLRHKLTGLVLGDLPKNPLRRPFAGVEMGICTALLAPILVPAATNFVAALTLIPFLANFGYDWLVMTGGLRPRKSKPFNSSRLISPISFLVRVCLGSLLIWQSLALMDPVSKGIGFLLAALLLLGVGVRLVALVLLVAISTFFNMAAIQYFLLFGLISLVYLGPGSFALWEPENILITKRLGERIKS